MASGAEQRFVIPPTDQNRGWKVSRNVADYLRQAARRARDQGVPQEVLFRPVQKQRTDPQRMTLWMWHGQVASELALRTGALWTKDDVHEVIFLPRFMPQRELIDPQTGEVLTRSVRTSDRRPPEGDDRDMREIISDAMDDYLRWIFEMEIEVTVPEGGW